MTDAYIAYLRTIALGVGGPDTTPGKESWAEKTVRGISGGVDYRGIIPVSGSVELTSFGGWYSFTALEIYQEANNVKKTSHFFLGSQRRTGYNRTKVGYRDSSDYSI